MKKNIPTILVYLTGMLSFFLVDLIVARYESTNAIANWALTKSVIMIGGTIALFGMDHVMVRLPNQAMEILKRSYSQIFITVSIYSLIVYKMGLLTEGLWVFIGTISLGLSLLFFGFYRSQFSLFSAQLITNGWKPLFLIILVSLLFFEIHRIYSALFFFSIATSIFFTFILNRKYQANLIDKSNLQQESVFQQYTLGARFFISLMTLNLSLYLEQVLLNMGSHTTDSSIYFSHFAVILPIMIIFNGYLGFLLGPYIRRDNKKFDAFLKTYWWLFFVAAIFLGFISLLFANFFYSYILNNKNEFMFHLALIITCIGALRIIYILPSSYLGVLANKKILDKFIAMNIFGIIILIGGFYFFYQLTNNALYSIAYASLLNWLIRTIYGNYLVWTIWKKRTSGNVYE